MGKFEIEDVLVNRGDADSERQCYAMEAGKFKVFRDEQCSESHSKSRGWLG